MTRAPKRRPAIGDTWHDARGNNYCVTDLIERRGRPIVKATRDGGATVEWPLPEFLQRCQPGVARV